MVYWGPIRSILVALLFPNDVAADDDGNGAGYRISFARQSVKVAAHHQKWKVKHKVGSVYSTKADAYVLPSSVIPANADLSWKLGNPKSRA